MTKQNLCGIISFVEKKHAAMAQLVEHILGKDEVPSSNLGSSSKTKSTSQEVLFVLERCVPLARNMMRPSGVMFPSEVMCASRVRRNTSHHCDQREQHHYGEAITSLRRSRNITIYKRSILCYNITESEVLPWLNPNSANYQWNFPSILLTLSNT